MDLTACIFLQRSACESYAFKVIWFFSLQSFEASNGSSLSFVKQPGMDSIKMSVTLFKSNDARIYEERYLT